MALQGEMILRVWDVEHGACAMVQHAMGQYGGKLAMIDSGSTDDWRPSDYIRHDLGRTKLDYLFITNADQDHMSDLQGLWDAGITVPVMFRNPSYTGEQMRQIKRQSGPLSADAERYVSACSSFNQPIDEPFDLNMGGITATTFWNPYPTFTDTNNLSLVVFIKYSNFKILFPGDLEKAGWRALLQRPDFCAELRGTDVLVASHHGRESGYCADIFNYFTPSRVLKISASPSVFQRPGKNYAGANPSRSVSMTIRTVFPADGARVIERCGRRSKYHLFNIDFRNARAAMAPLNHDASKLPSRVRL